MDLKPLEISKRKWSAIRLPQHEELRARQEYIWEAVFSDGSKRTYDLTPSYALVVDGEGEPISHECWGDGEQDTPYYLYFTVQDARLIAAAPDMLEACEDVRQIVSDWVAGEISDKQMVDRIGLAITPAIAKATGEQVAE